jgi:hypothetical protein
MGNTFNTGRLGNGLFTDASGNVGIGNTTPSYKLDVTGTARITGVLISNARIQAQGSNGAGAAQGGFWINYNTNSTSSRSWLINNDLNVFGDFAIMQSTTQTGSTFNSKFYINASGDVGIGTSSPDRRLSVVSSGAGVEAARFTDGANADLIIGFPSASVAMITAEYGGAGTLAFGTGTSRTERMRITSTGNVGIGTSSPSGILHAMTSSIAEIFVESTTAGNNAAFISKTTARKWGMGANMGLSDSSWELYDYTSGANRLVVKSNGNFLVGTTTDRGYKFQVSAAIYAPQFIAFGLNDEGRYLGQGNQISGAFQSYDLSLANYAASGRITITNASTGVYLANSATSWSTFSDERLKNINYQINNAVDKLLNIRAVNYSWKKDEEQKENLGLIAQDVEKVLPQVIDKSKHFDEKDDTEYLSVKYTELIPVLVAAIQELKAEIDILKNK